MSVELLHRLVGVAGLLVSYIVLTILVFFVMPSKRKFPTAKRTAGDEEELPMEEYSAPPEPITLNVEESDGIRGILEENAIQPPRSESSNNSVYNTEDATTIRNRVLAVNLFQDDEGEAAFGSVQLPGYTNASPTHTNVIRMSVDETERMGPHALSPRGMAKVPDVPNIARQFDQVVNNLDTPIEADFPIASIPPSPTARIASRVESHQ